MKDGLEYKNYKQYACPYCGKLNCGYNEDAEYDGVKSGGCKNDK